jgi:hypothetical protein
LLHGCNLRDLRQRIKIINRSVGGSLMSHRSSI